MPVNVEGTGKGGGRISEYVITQSGVIVYVTTDVLGTMNPLKLGVESTTRFPCPSEVKVPA
jgi:hypothetical protein